MGAEQQVFEALKHLVGGNVFPNVVPENVASPPYVVYQLIGVQTENTLEGYTGHALAHLQVDVYAQDFDDGLALAREVIWAVNKKVAFSQFLQRESLFEMDGFVGGLHRQSLEFYVWQTDC